MSIAVISELRVRLENKLIMKYMETRHYHLTAVFIVILLLKTTTYAQTVPDEAKKYYNRGQAAIELATTQVDYQDAISEFKSSIDIAPNWAEPYLVIAQVYEKLENYFNAIDNYKKYLTLSPSGNNTDAIKTIIDKLGYKLDKQNEKNKIISVLVSWNQSGSNVHFTKTGGSPGGVYVLKKFILNGDKLMAYIPYYMKDTGLRDKLILAEQTVPVDFDGRIMKFSYEY